MNSRMRTLRSGLVVIVMDDHESWHGPRCLCKWCKVQDWKEYGYSFRKEIKEEARTRKCIRKRCKREGCSCQGE